VRVNGHTPGHIALPIWKGDGGTRVCGILLYGTMTIGHGIGALLVLLLIAFIGVYSGKKVKNASDFVANGRSGGVCLTAGALVGTLVGGASTIGTAQLAFTYGFSAWWFTLGGGIGLFIMALFFAKPMYQSGHLTLPQMLTAEFGRKTATIATLCMSLGTFMSIISQMLSGVALVTSVVDIAPLVATGVIVLLMTAYVFFGGAWGAGMAGVAKTVLLYLATFICGITALRLGGGVSRFVADLPHETYFNLFARGGWKDGGAGMSLVFGVLTTQSYILPVVSAKNLKTSRQGTILGGVLTIIIGIAGIFVGMFMRLTFPDMDPSGAMPQFVMMYLPDFIGGVILAVLLVALVGTGAGLVFGISTMVTKDIYCVFLKPDAPDRAQLRFSRGVILAVLILAAAISAGEAGSLILSWSFLSMGLRGAVAFAPLCFSLFAPGRVSGRVAAAAIITGPVLVFVSSFLLPPHIDPLFPGIAGTLLICLLGMRRKVHTC